MVVHDEATCAKPTLLSASGNTIKSIVCLNYWEGNQEMRRYRFHQSIPSSHEAGRTPARFRCADMAVAE